MNKEIELLVGHYEKTYEITLKVWEQRNRTFLILLVSEYSFNGYFIFDGGREFSNSDSL
jgi:hypothetical protein